MLLAELSVQRKRTCKVLFHAVAQGLRASTLGGAPSAPHMREVSPKSGWPQSTWPNGMMRKFRDGTVTTIRVNSTDAH
jgi:hypothetical protein